MAKPAGEKKGKVEGKKADDIDAIFGAMKVRCTAHLLLPQLC